MKIQRHIKIDANFVKTGVNKTIGHVNKGIKYDELESSNETTMCVNKDKQTLSAYDIRVKKRL